MKALLLMLVPCLALAQGYPSRSAAAGVVYPGESWVAAGLGEDVSFEKVTVTGTSSSACAVEVLSGRMCMAPITVSGNAGFWFDAGTGFNLSNQLLLAAGAPLFADYWVPRQNGIPVSVGDADGTLFALQSSPGTCDAAHKGAVVGVTESATSATRLCRCIRTSSTGDYRWLNMDTATRGTTTTDCPDTTP